MFIYPNLENKKLRHAYGIAGDVNVAVSELKEMISKNLGVATVGNPDFFCETFETLTIEDARRIQDIHASKPFSSDRPRIFLIAFYGITREAQNALLKIIEEPQPGNHFFLVMPSFDLFLPTLRSRLNIVRSESSHQSESQFDGISTDFIKKSYKDKIVFVDAMAAAVSEGTTAKHETVDFLNRLESTLYAQKDLVGNVATFSAIARARSYMNDRAPSVKMLLEYVALNV